MITPEPVYQKLPGGGFNWSGRGSLWVGQDHLLEASSTFIVERYRRFFFREIKAFTVRRTSARFVWAMVQGGIAVVCLVVGGAFAWSGLSNSAADWHVAMYVMASIFAPIALVCLAMLAVNLALGPSCRCHVLTSTGWHALAAPTRLSAAILVQARIVPLIAAAQGDAPAAEAPVTQGRVF